MYTINITDFTDSNWIKMMVTSLLYQSKMQKRYFCGCVGLGNLAGRSRVSYGIQHYDFVHFTHFVHFIPLSSLSNMDFYLTPSTESNLTHLSEAQ